ncbi:unnamed protein product [Ectocarpus fasciculatus]
MFTPDTKAVNDHRSGTGSTAPEKQQGGDKTVKPGGRSSIGCQDGMYVDGRGYEEDTRLTSFEIGDGGECRAQNGAGGNPVIPSGFGAGCFPKHRWLQHQGGSSDGMLILYGSPS